MFPNQERKMFFSCLWRAVSRENRQFGAGEKEEERQDEESLYAAAVSVVQSLASAYFGPLSRY